MFKLVFSVKALLVLLIFLCAWIASTFYWNASVRMPETWDLWLHGLIGPAMLSALALRVQQLTGRREQPLQDAPEAEDTLLEIGKGVASSYRLAVHGHALSLPLDGVENLSFDLRVLRGAPSVHPLLSQAQGQPVQAAWNRSLAVDHVREANRLATLDAEVGRALLLLDSVLLEIFNYPDFFDRGVVSQVHFLTPERWGAKGKRVAEEWLNGHISDYLITPWQLQTHAVADARSALNFLDQLNVQINSQKDDSSHVLLISDSFVGQKTVDAWLAEKQLLGADFPDGQIPGEGACGFLLKRPNPVFSEHSKITTGRMVFGLTDAAPRAPREEKPALLAALFQRINLSADQVSHLVSDADHRPSQANEVAGFITHSLPTLDTKADYVDLSYSCGQMGIVSGLAAIGLAAKQTSVTQKVGLMVSVNDPDCYAMLSIHPSCIEAVAAKIIQARTPLPRKTNGIASHD